MPFMSFDDPTFRFNAPSFFEPPRVPVPPNSGVPPQRGAGGLFPADPRVPSLQVTPWQPFQFPSVGHWEEAVAQVLVDAPRVEGVTVATVKWMRTAFRSFRATLLEARAERAFLGGELKDQVRCIDAWIATLRERGRSRATLQTHWRGFHALCRRVGRTTAMLNPCDWATRPKAAPRVPRALSRAEAFAVLEFLRHHPWRDALERTRNLALIGCLLFAGLRLGELLRLKNGDVDLDLGALHIWQSKGPNGGKDRTVYLAPQLEEFLRQYLAERRRRNRTHAAFFTAIDKARPMGVATVRRLCALISASIQVHVWPHLFRHTFASLLLQAGISSRIGQAAMGHHHLSTFERYGKVFDADQAAAMQRVRLDDSPPPDRPHRNESF